MRVAVAVAVAFVAVVAACGAPPPRPLLPPPPPPPARPVVVVAAAPLPPSPGPLTAVHAALACLDCHVDNLARIDSNKCVGCHEHQDLAARMTSGRGFHASAVVARKPCERCHHDHRGALYAQVDWSVLPGGRAAFDHDLTGWPLAGAHQNVTCEDCHKAKSAQGDTIFVGTDRLCGTCHKADNPHGTTRRELLACERCHSVAVWHPVKAAPAFDHDDRHDARMPLLGAHADVRCVKCHPKEKFNLQLAEPSACENCHTAPHAHAKTIKASRPCAECHSPTFKQFTPATFDHAERTRFDLGQSHAKLACSACHSAALGVKPPSPGCESCHAGRSPHKDRFQDLGAPPRCAACHVPSPPYDPKTPTVRAPWVVHAAFDHAKNGNWRLTGKHSQIACRDCHRGTAPTFEKLAPHAECMGCHAHATVHSDTAHPNGAYTNQDCIRCHL